MRTRAPSRLQAKTGKPTSFQMASSVVSVSSVFFSCAVWRLLHACLSTTLPHAWFGVIADALSPYDPFDTCAGSGGGAMHMSASATVTVTSSSFTGCSTINANGGSVAIISDTPLEADQSVLTVTDTTFGASASSHYGAITFATLSKASLTNVEVTATDAEIQSLSGVFFNSGGSMTCTATCLPGSYGNCTAVNDCFSCLIDECTDCPVCSKLCSPSQNKKALMRTTRLQ